MVIKNHFSVFIWCTTCTFWPAQGKVCEIKRYIYNLIFASINLMFKLNATAQNSHKKIMFHKKFPPKDFIIRTLAKTLNYKRNVS